jgi:hypothetical protein
MAAMAAMAAMAELPWPLSAPPTLMAALAALAALAGVVWESHASVRGQGVAPQGV